MCGSKAPCKIIACKLLKILLKNSEEISTNLFIDFYVCEYFQETTDEIAKRAHQCKLE